MKKTLFIIGLLLFVVCNASAQGIKIYKKDGSLIRFPYSDIDSLVAYSYVDPSTIVEHEVVDLGLSVKWATCNIGANEPEEAGLYFAWGETTGYAANDEHVFSWGTYSLCKGSEKTLTKYCSSFDYGIFDNKKLLEPEDDAAIVNWGGAWRMPTRKELSELIDKCQWSNSSMNGVNGYIITSKTNGNSIFIPMVGYINEAGLQNYNRSGYYLSSSLDGNTHSYYLLSISSGIYTKSGARCIGNPIRAVCP